MFRSDRVSLLHALYAKYPLMPPHYVYHFVECLAGIEGNAQIVSYVDADLGALDRGLALVDSIIAAGYRVSGARCLDIGCSNGALLVAAQMRGAGRCLGVDLSEARLVSARKVCVGKPIDLLRSDVASDAIPGTYDVVFCTDVLEHVPEWSRIIDQIRGALAPGGSAFVFLHNARQPSSVRSEPHYGVPGLVLLPRAQAAEVWCEIHDEVGGDIARPGDLPPAWG
jgi:SAM-dependent methyltransferase